MLYGTLIFSDAMSKPKHLDSESCDWEYPIQARPTNYALQTTRTLRKCYRSKRINIRPVFKDTGIQKINAHVFIHNAENLVQGALRLYFWRPTVPDTDTYDITPTSIGAEDFLELVVRTYTITNGIAIGTVVLDTVFDDIQVVVMQPCSGVSVYFSPPGLMIGPTVGPAHH